MRTMKHWALAAAAAAALALAGCGGGGSGGTARTPADTPTDPPPPANLTALFGAAQTASSDAAAAGEAAAAAVKAAVDSAKMLTTTQVGGDSMKAMMNAQAILDARDDAAQAVMDAEAALAAAKKAQMDAMDIAADHPQKSALMAAAETAVMAAEEQVKAATAVRDGRALDDEVFKVVGAGGKGTPRSIADAVGKDIAESVSPGSNVGRNRGAHEANTTNFDSVTDDGLKYSTNDAQGMTWAEIVGEANVMDVRRLANNAVAPVKAASVMGSMVDDLDTSGSPPADGSNSAANTDGTSFAASYMGIPGTVFCAGTDCAVGDDGNLAGSWYFTPTSTTASYINNPNRDVSEDTPYVEESMYASYGYWLTSTGDPLAWTVNTFATSAGGSIVNLAAGTTTNGLADTATYSGKAVGMSVHKTPKAGGGNHIDSGMFTADVMLTARFSDTATDQTVSGTIDNFQGDAVGSGWTVRLDPITQSTTGTSGTAVASGENGSWSATVYGNDASKRPAGIHGGFSAHFLDGHAAGAYATRADE